MNAGLPISTAAHVGVLVGSLLTFSANPFEVPPVESLPVDIVSETEFSQITAGSKSGAKTETPRSLVEKVAEPKAVEDPTRKVADKPEVRATAEREPPPLPEPNPKSKTTPARSEPRPDPIAEAIKKDEQRKSETHTASIKIPIPPQRPKPEPPKFDPKQVAALLDKRDPVRRAATGEVLVPATSLGLATGHAVQLSQSELDALRAKLASLWNPPGTTNPEELIVSIRIKLNRDGTLASPPVVLTSGRSPLFVAARDSAVRAIFQGQPFTMLRQETYDTWKDVEITFDPREMFRG